MTPERDRQLERTREVLAEKDEEARVKAKQGQLGNSGRPREDRDDAPGAGARPDEQDAEESNG